MSIYSGVKLAMKYCTSNTSIKEKNNTDNRHVRAYLKNIQRDWGVAAEDFPD